MQKPVIRAFYLVLMLASSTPALAQVEVIEIDAAVTSPVVIDSQSRNMTDGASASATNRRASSNSEPGQLYYQLQLLQQEVMTLRGQLEQQAHELRRLKQQSLDRYVDVDRRLAEISGSPVAQNQLPTANTAATSKPAEITTSRPARTPPTVAVATSPPGEYAAYRSAYELVRAQRFDDAVAAFKDFLNRYSSGQYVPNAHYWLGELYLVITPQDLEASRQSFSLLLEKFPDNSKVPDALYKLGKVHFLKGNPERSREVLERLIAEHGNSGSTAVQLARTFIDENF